MEVQENIPLAQYTTFQIGGPARYFARASSVEDVREALAFAKERDLKFFVLGGGSNVLFDDAGFDGLVIKVELSGVERQGDVFIAGAGESWDALAARAASEGLWGIENLSGIPGTVGGALVQNIGAYGAALSQTFRWAEALDTMRGEVKKIDRQEYASGYRESVFKHSPGRYVVLRAALALSPTPVPNLSYTDLAARFAPSAAEGVASATPGLADIRSAVLEIRAGKFPDLALEGTAGSFFKNPVLPKARAQELAARYPGMPVFALPESQGIKVPLSWLLDYRHGVIDMRSVRAGGARMYEKQFLVLVAHRGGSSADVKKLAALVQEKVHATVGIEIEPEVCVM